MHGVVVLSGYGRHEVGIEAVGVEGREGRHEHCHGAQAAEERLVGREFVGVHLSGPEALAVEAHVPVAEVGVHEGGDGAGGACGLVVVEVGFHLFHQRV